jgi:hypothetical protein
VSFSSTPEVYPTITRKDYSRAEIKACWFNGRDYERTVKKCQKIIENKEGLKYCTRGMERLSETGLHVTICNRNDAYQAVFDHRRIRSGQVKLSPERIAERYREVAHRCQKRAVKLAELDAIAAAKH